MLLNPIEARKELPRYRCHKVVMALKIREVICLDQPDPDASDSVRDAFLNIPKAILVPEDGRFQSLPVSEDWFRNHDPKPGGYYVLYEDSYSSFSPAEAFEKGYTLISDEDAPGFRL